MKTYTTRTGLTQYMPSIEEVSEAGNDFVGFCLACGNVQEGCEPDARKYRCEECGKDKVYGGEELALMGLVY